MADNPFMKHGSRGHDTMAKARAAKARKRDREAQRANAEKLRRAISAKRELPKLDREYSTRLAKLTKKKGAFTEQEEQEWNELHKLGNQIRSLGHIIRK